MPRPERTASDAEALAHLLTRQAGYTYHLIPAGLAGCNSNGGTRHLQKFCEEIDAGVVGFAIDGRSGERDLEHVADYASDSVFLRSGMNFDGESSARRFCHKWGSLVAR